ncbi:MAG: 50S ribosomal protein L18 [Candidatus Zixiibacteriota bacterium]
MADKNIKRQARADRRRRRIRGKVSGTSSCPRLTVAKSLKNTFVQIIDDEKRITLAAAASNAKDVASKATKEMTKTQIAKEVGKCIAEAAKSKGIEKVVFDRNTNRYHGRIKAVADGAREAGLKF